MTLYVKDRALWERVIDAWPEWEVTASEKLLARHLPDILDWCGEQAETDEDFWGDRVHIYPSMCNRQTGMSRTTVWRILKRWNDCQLISKRSENYQDNQGQYHGRTFIEISLRFYDGDIRTGRENTGEHKRGPKPGRKYVICSECGTKHYLDSAHIHEEETIEQESEELV